MSSYTFFDMKNAYEVNMMNSENYSLKRFAHSVGQNWYHVVLIPRGRFALFQWIELKILAEQAIKWICERHRIELFALEVMPDHIHLFVCCPPVYSIRKMIRILKGGSSYYIRSKQPSLKKYKHLWSGGVMYRSVGSVNADTVKRYIEGSNDWDKSKQGL